MFWLIVNMGNIFILMPLIELAILVYVGTIIGPLYTILIVVVTGMLGASLAKSQGLAILAKIRRSLDAGIIPSNEFFEGALVLAGGLLLLTPGIITDIIGFAMLIPPTRFLIVKWLRHVIQRKIQSGEVQYWEIK